MKHLVYSFMAALMLGSCTLGTPKIGPADIYEYEANHYPSTSWEYVGSKGRWHYFNRPTDWLMNCDLKLNRKYLPDLHGFPYYAKPAPQRDALSSDVEIHAEYIRIHIDGQPPYQIPFKSKGFITAEHRRGSRDKIRVYSNGRDVTEDIKSSIESPTPVR